MNTILNSLVSNILLLIGGLVMCLFTSWRLSLLAFTSIGPIIYVTSVYARWSRGLNHQIWAALGDANSIATEAISNVRTVRAFGRELGEIFRFNESIGMALSKGVKDAIAGAGTYAITNYIDLGAGILILAYGGTGRVVSNCVHCIGIGERRLVVIFHFPPLTNSNHTPF